MMKTFLSVAPLLLALIKAEEWGYQSENPTLLSPSQWDESFPNCDGARQSPINIPTYQAVPEYSPMPLSFSGRCDQFSMTQEETAFKGIQENGDCQVHLGGQNYNFLQFHTHTPSEHTINGQHMDAEVHFVHQLEGGKDRLVLGMFVQITDDPLLENFWLGQAWADGEQVHEEGGTPKNVNIRGSYSALLASLSQHGPVYNYPGSLTTPPCDENVNWWVFRAPVMLTRANYNSFVSKMQTMASLENGHNNRPPQPLKGRTVVAYHPLPPSVLYGGGAE